ncbi:MAG: hypothetical protein QM498_13045 [Desulfobacterium sp.]
MSKLFSMQRQNLGNDLFINLFGEFDGSSAWQLANTILTRFHGQGKLFIDARDLSKVVPNAAEIIVTLVPNSLVKKKDVLIRDWEGTHSGLEHFYALCEKTFLGEIPCKCVSATSIC